MTNNYTTLDDVKKFIKSKLNYTWNGTVCKGGHLICVKDFNQLASMGACTPLFGAFETEFLQPTCLRVSTTKFQVITAEMNDFCDGYEYDISADHSVDWMKYQCDKYGDEFRFLCLAEIEENRMADAKKFDRAKSGLIRKMIELENEAKFRDEQYAILKSEISTSGLKK